MGKIFNTLPNDPIDLDSIENKIFTLWYLARACYDAKLLETANNYHERSKELIHKLEEKISDEDDRNYFKNNLYYYNKIKETINDDDKTSPEKKGQVQPTVFQFCPKCGKKNEDQFAFCPSCGDDLKQKV